MKKLITYFVLIFCLVTNAQTPKDLASVEQKLVEETANWRNKLESQIKELNAKLEVLTLASEHQTNYIAELYTKSRLDSLKIVSLNKQIRYTQTFIKDTIQIICNNQKVEEVDLISEVASINAAWIANSDRSFTYNHNVSNYSYIKFNLIENLQPNTTYIISFNIELNDSSRQAQISFWAYSDNGNRAVNDTYYSNGKHDVEYTPEEFERLKFGIRARNNNGGSFTISDLRIISKK
jgi:hypothetical protein